MNALLDCLDQLPAGAVGTVVHVGAGAGDEIERYAALAPDKVLLVEGDPEVLPELRRRAGDFPWAQVLDTAVTPQGGPTRWHRFNLRTLNGPLQPEGLARLYPRLRELDGTQLGSSRLADVLNPLLGASTDERGALLVLDVPGQEDGLLASLGPQLPEAFDWVLLRGCSIGGGGGWATAGAAVTRLRDAGFTVSATPSASAEGPWPVTLLHLDRQRLELVRLRERVTAMERELTQAQQDRGALSARLQAKEDEAAALRSAAESAATRAVDMARAHAEESRRLRDESQRVQAELKNEISHLGQTVAAASQLATERLEQVTQLAKVREEELQRHERQSSELEARLATLQADAARLDGERGDALVQLQRAKSQIQQLLTSEAAAAKAAGERSAEISRLTREHDEQRTALQRESEARGAEFKSRLDRLTEELQQTRTQLAAATEERDGTRTALRELQSRLDALAKAEAAARQLAEDRAAMLAQASLAREEQSRLSAERGSALDESQARVVTLEAALHEARQQCQAAEARAAELGNAVVEAQAALTETAAQRDGLAQRVDALGGELRELRQAHATLEQQLTERQARIDHLSHAEGSASKLAAERAAQLAQALRARDEQAEVVRGLRGEMEARDKDTAALRARLEQASGAAAQREQQDRELRSRLERELADARQTANLSVKLQSLRESDLRDLQQRYRTVLSEQQSQHELLTKLAQRLSTANEYFHRLSLTAGSAPADDRRARAPAGERRAVAKLAATAPASSPSAKPATARRKPASGRTTAGAKGKATSGGPA